MSTGKKLGYGRVSSKSQDTGIQEAVLTEWGADKLFIEKISGRSRAKRVELAALLDYVRDGDTVAVTRLDRIARSARDLLNIIQQIEDAGASFMCVQQPEINTASPHGRLMMTLLSAFAQFETELRAERQREGIDKALAEVESGEREHWGRKSKYDYADVYKRFQAAGNKAELARELGMSRSRLYAIVSEYEAAQEAG